MRKLAQLVSTPLPGRWEELLTVFMLGLFVGFLIWGGKA